MLREKAQPRASAPNSAFTLSHDEIEKINAKGGPTFSPRSGGRVAINQFLGRGAFSRAKIAYVRAVCGPHPKSFKPEPAVAVVAKPVYVSADERRLIHVVRDQTGDIRCPYCTRRMYAPLGTYICSQCEQKLYVDPARVMPAQSLVRVKRGDDDSVICPRCAVRRYDVTLGHKECRRCGTMFHVYYP